MRKEADHKTTTKERKNQGSLAKKGTGKQVKEMATTGKSAKSKAKGVEEAAKKRSVSRKVKKKTTKQKESQDDTPASPSIIPSSPKPKPAPRGTKRKATVIEEADEEPRRREPDRPRRSQWMRLRYRSHRSWGLNPRRQPQNSRQLSQRIPVRHSKPPVPPVFR